MEKCEYCKNETLVDTGEGVSCSSCARVQNIMIFGTCSREKTALNTVTNDSCRMLDELSERLGLDQRAMLSIKRRLKVLRSKKSNYTIDHFASSLHYIHQMETGTYMSTLGYTQVYNGCIDSDTLEKCVKYVTKTLKLEHSDHASEWRSLIQPYVKTFHLSEGDVQSAENYCGKIFTQCGASVYDIAMMSVVMHCIDNKGASLRSSLIKIEERHRIPENSLSKMYFRLRKKHLNKMSKN